MDALRYFPETENCSMIASLPSLRLLQNSQMQRSSTAKIVAIDESGRPSFSRLQNFSANANAITFYAFDMPMWKGEDQRLQSLLRFDPFGVRNYGAFGSRQN